MIYLDSAATSQTPKEVLDAMGEYYRDYRANVHRGVYDASVKATQQYEAARSAIAKFINADSREIIFNSGATAGLNQLAYSLSPRLSHRDNVVLSRLEHHANLVPWQQMAKHYGFEIRFIELNTEKTNLDVEHAKKLIDENTKIVSFSLASNVLGCITPTQEIINLVRAQSPKAYTILDAAQAMAHFPVDVKNLDCDFLVFSGHKMYGPTGIGVLYGKKIMLEEHIEPFLFGGEMVTSVNYETAQWNEIPWRYEAGTPNIAGAIGLGAAVKYIENLGWKKMQTHEQELQRNLIDQLKKIDGITLLTAKPDFGLLAFTIAHVHPHDVAEVLNGEGIAVRAGFHCAEPLHRLLGFAQGTVRVSLGIQNTKEEIEKLAHALQKVIKTFKS
jgi:cysteine desulfurase/selenocysteine lyase